MFGPRLSTVFASRWRAIWFSASVLLFAWMSVPGDEPEDANAAQSSFEQVNAAAAASGLSPEGQKQVEDAVKSLEALSGGG